MKHPEDYPLFCVFGVLLLMYTPREQKANEFQHSVSRDMTAENNTCSMICVAAVGKRLNEKPPSAALRSQPRVPPPPRTTLFLLALLLSVHDSS